MVDKIAKYTLTKIADELRNPTTIINSYLQLLVQNHPELEEDPYLDQLQGGIDDLVVLLEDLEENGYAPV